jgi:AraC family transcriptional regulator
MSNAYTMNPNFLYNCKKKGAIMITKIVELGEMMFIGLEYYGENQNNEIGEMWGEFMKIANMLPNRTDNKNAYGVCFSDEGDIHPIRYIAGFEVSTLATIPEGMKGKAVKPGKYAVFTHTGLLHNLKETYHNIYTKWLPEANLKPVEGLLGLDFELYDDRFNPESPNSEFDIYVRIQN